MPRSTRTIRTRIPRDTALAATTLAALLALTACSGGGENSGDAAPGGDAEERSGAEVLDAAVDATLGTRAFAVTSSAALNIDGQDISLDVTGRVDYDAVVADFAFSADQEGQLQSIAILADGETAWVSAEGGAVPAFPDGATYLAGAAADLAEASTFQPAGILGVLFALRAAEDTEPGETEEIDGVETRSYTTTVSYPDAVEAAGAEAESFQSALSLTGQAEQADLDLEVWVGPDDVVRRFELEVDAGDVPVDGSYSIEVSDVGGDIEAPEPPAEDEVSSGPEAEALFAQLLS